jgi:RND family efflux transporter MFP subunit
VDAFLRIGLTNAGWAAVLALAAAVMVRLRRRSPTLAHGLWLLVLLKLATPGLLSLSLPPERPTEAARSELPPASVFASPAPPAEQVPRPIPSTRPGPAKDLAAETPPPFRIPEPQESEPRASGALPWKEALISLWVAGAVLWWLTIAVQTARFARLTRAAWPASESLRTSARELAHRLGLGHCPEILFVPVRVPPMLWALFGRPRVFLPEELWSGLDEPAREAVLAHELAHLRRGDHWVRRLEAVVLGLYWWNPFAWWARREVERAEEQCCDAWVTWTLPGSAASYARALVVTADYLSGPRSPWPLCASGVGLVPLLKGRLNMILRNPASRPAPRALLFLAVLVLPFLPTWASAQTPAEKSQEVPAEKPAPPQAPVTAPVVAPKAQEGVRDEPKGSKPDKPNGLPRVHVTRPIVKQVEDYADFTGRIEAARSAEIRPRIGGTLEQIEVLPGAMVKKGDLMFGIDARPYLAELARAVAALKRAEAQRDRATAVVGRNKRMIAKNPGLVPQEDIDKADAELAEANALVGEATANRQLALLNVQFARITAPIGGRVGNIAIEPGSVVVADRTTLTTVVEADRVYVYFDVDERTLLRLLRLRRDAQAKGPEGLKLAVEVRLAADEDGAPRRSTLDVLADRLDPNTGTARLRVLLPNADGTLLPGMFARVRLMTGPTHEVLLVPTTSTLVQQPGEGVAIFVVNDEGVVEKPIVNLGLLFDGLRSVTSGLKPDAWVVVGWREVTPPGLSGGYVGKTVTPIKAQQSLGKPETRQPRPGR